MFSPKDKTPEYLKANVIYYFTCAACNSSYVGETYRHLNTRIKEHLTKKSQPSSIFKHLDANVECRLACNDFCFNVIDKASSKYNLEIKEAFHTNWLNPKITKQKKLALTISA